MLRENLLWIHLSKQNQIPLARIRDRNALAVKIAVDPPTTTVASAGGLIEGGTECRAHIAKRLIYSKTEQS